VPRSGRFLNLAPQLPGVFHSGAVPLVWEPSLVADCSLYPSSEAARLTLVRQIGIVGASVPLPSYLPFAAP
jgi:hypothetical protein